MHIAAQNITVTLCCHQTNAGESEKYMCINHLCLQENVDLERTGLLPPVLKYLTTTGPDVVLAH